MPTCPTILKWQFWGAQPLVPILEHITGEAAVIQLLHQCINLVIAGMAAHEVFGSSAPYHIIIKAEVDTLDGGMLG